MSKIHISKSISICLSVSACCNLRFCNFQPRHPYNQYNRVSTFLEVARNGYCGREPCAMRVDSVSHLDGDGGDVVPDGGREPDLPRVAEDLPQTVQGTSAPCSTSDFSKLDSAKNEVSSSCVMIRYTTVNLSVLRVSPATPVEHFILNVIELSHRAKECSLQWLGRRTPF